MARLVWTHRATADIDEIAAYIDIHNPAAARRFVERVFSHVEQLTKHLMSGLVPPELEDSRYRQIVEPPCRIFYRFDGKAVYIVHVMRFERLLRMSRIESW